jgi:hypothetical protein
MIVMRAVGCVHRVASVLWGMLYFLAGLALWIADGVWLGSVSAAVRGEAGCRLVARGQHACGSPAWSVLWVPGLIMLCLRV